MVYAHRMKVYASVFLLLNACFQRQEVCRQVLLPLLQRFLHTAVAPPHAAFFQHLQGAFHIVKFLLHDAEHCFFRLRYLCELVMRQNDAVPIIVLDFAEKFLTVGRGEVLLAGIEQLCRWVSLAETVGYFMHVGFQPYYQRLLYQPQAFHFVCRHAHHHCFTCAYLMPAHTAAILLNHPDGVFLRGVQVIVGELCKGKAGECLRRTIIGRAHITVETLVVEPYQLVTDGDRPAVKPSVELAPYLLYLGCHLLHGFFIGYFHPFTATHHLFFYFGYGVMQGMGKQFLACVTVRGIDVVCGRGISM